MTTQVVFQVGRPTASDVAALAGNQGALVSVSSNINQVIAVGNDLLGDDTIGTTAAYVDVINIVGTDLDLGESSSTRTVAGALRDGTIDDLLYGQVGKIADYAALTAIPVTTLSGGEVKFVSGRTSNGDGGEGNFYYDAASTATADGGTILAPDVGDGRWLRIGANLVSKPVFTSWFGNDAAGIQAALDSGARHIIFDGGDVTLTDGLTMTGPASGAIFEGATLSSGDTAILRYAGSGDLLTVSNQYNGVVRNLELRHTGPSGKVVNFADGEFHQLLGSTIYVGDVSSTDVSVYFRSSSTIIADNTFNGNRPAFAIHSDRTSGLVNINSVIRDNYFGGVGKAILAKTSDGSARQEGLLIDSNTFVCTGQKQIEVHEHLDIRIVNNMLDQGDQHCIWLTPTAQGIDGCLIADNYISTAANTTGGVGVEVDPAAAGNVGRLRVKGNYFAFSGYGLAVGATVASLTVIGNDFGTCSQLALGINQAKNVTVVANQFGNLGGNNFLFADGAAGGPFTITGNHFDPLAGFTYTPTNVANITWTGNFGRKFSSRTSSVINASSTGSSFAVIAHGLSSTPAKSKLLATVMEESGAHSDIRLRVASVDATNVTVEVFWTTINAGDLRVNVYSEA